MLITRVLAAMIFAPLMLGAIYLGAPVLACVCMALGLVMLWEFCHLARIDISLSTKIMAYILTLVIFTMQCGFMVAWADKLVLPFCLFLTMLAMLMHLKPIESSIQRAAVLVFAVIYCGSLLPFLVRLRALPQDGLGFAIMALLCTWGADTGAYFVGKSIGRHALSPVISPSKTWEGAMGGVVCAMVIAQLVPWAFHMDLAVYHELILGALAGVFGLCGDLFESMIKRSAGAKDSSGLIPGHGGVLDRFDGVLFALPAFYAYIVMFVIS